MPAIEVKITYPWKGKVITLAHAKIDSNEKLITFELKEDAVVAEGRHEITVARSGLKVQVIKVPWWRRAWRRMKK